MLILVINKKVSLCQPVNLVPDLCCVTFGPFEFACGPNEYSDQPAHPLSLTNVYDKRYMSSQDSNAFTARKLRLMGLI